jgi:hypothetical protein
MDWGEYQTYISEARLKLGDDMCHCLKLVFETSAGEPPWVLKDKFRVENRQFVSICNELENNHQLLKTERKGKSYVFPAHVLGLFDSPRATEILDLMEQSFVLAKNHYEENTGKSLFVEQFLEELDAPNKDIKEALSYLRDCRIFAGIDEGFPYREKSSVTVAEDTIIKAGLAEFLTEPLKWSSINQPTETVFSTSESIGSYVGIPFMGASEWSKDWFTRLDEYQQRLVKELDNSLGNGSIILPAIAIRALLESLMVNAIEDQGSFGKNLKAFRAQGYLADKDIDFLEAVLETGHAAIHRSHVPARRDIVTVSQVVKHLLVGLSLSEGMVDVKDGTPQRK